MILIVLSIPDRSYIQTSDSLELNIENHNHNGCLNVKS